MEESYKGMIAYRKKEISDDDLYTIPRKPSTKNTSSSSSRKKNKEQNRVKEDRVRCDCFGADHQYFSNCMGCGRILCIKEGEGPCLSCDTYVFSASDQDRIPQKYTEDPEFIKALELRDHLLALDREYANKAMKVHDLNTDWFKEANNLYSENTEYAREQYYKEEREKRIEAEIRRYDLDLSKGSITSAPKQTK